MAVTKHCRDGTSRSRLLYSDASYTKIGWKNMNGEKSRTTSMFNLKDVINVRAATDVDPDHVGSKGACSWDRPRANWAPEKRGDRRATGGALGQRLAGTETLRKCVTGLSYNRTFSMIFKYVFRHRIDAVGSGRRDATPLARSRTIDVELSTEHARIFAVKYLEHLIATAKGQPLALMSDTLEY
ncbi:hypothetical protein M885DRAFT_270616 [Pelagophyceae sp. CCMP2097]|nr:hypothetical protein M885DRAFT_270616 [Pelagophyceae sp. CCMP2097]